MYREERMEPVGEFGGPQFGCTVWVSRREDMAYKEGWVKSGAPWLPGEGMKKPVKSRLSHHLSLLLKGPHHRPPKKQANMTTLLTADRKGKFPEWSGRGQKLEDSRQGFWAWFSHPKPHSLGRVPLFLRRMKKLKGWVLLMGNSIST